MTYLQDNTASNTNVGKKPYFGLRIAMPVWRVEVAGKRAKSRAATVTRAEVLELFASDLEKIVAA